MTEPYEVLNGAPWAVVDGDCLQGMREHLPDESVDAAVMDPPSGISFMGASWDSDRGGADPWAHWLAGCLREAYRVLKPGGHVLVWALPRTSHWTGRAVELAGFEIRDRIHDFAAADDALNAFWDSLDPGQQEALVRIIDGQASPVLHYLVGSGFPKSLNVAKAMDKAAGVQPTKVEPATLGMAKNEQWNSLKTKLTMPSPTTPEAQEWDGWGTALKPAAEHWIMARKPLRERNIASNVKEHGAGAINIDACRVGTNAGWSYPNGRGGKGWGGQATLEQNLDEPVKATKGRHPAHVRLAHAPGCQPVGTKRVRASVSVRRNLKDDGADQQLDFKARTQRGADYTYAEADGKEPVEDWVCAAGCPIAALDEQNGDCKSRFYPTFPPFIYCPKPSRREKSAGCGGLQEKEWREGAKNCTPRSGQIYEQMGRCGKPRKNNHPCLAPGSVVLTEDGWRPIETLRVGVRVWTADGMFSPVVDVSSHRYGGPIYRVRVGGRWADATDNHPFLVLRGGRDPDNPHEPFSGIISWVEARRLRPGDLLLTPLLPENARGIVNVWDDVGHEATIPPARGTPPARATTASTGVGDFAWPTWSSGKMPTDSCPKAIGSTTAMATSRTIDCPTSNLSMTLHTSGSTPVASCGMVSGGSHAGCAVCSSPSPTSIGTSPRSGTSRTEGASHAIGQRSPSGTVRCGLHAVEAVEQLPYAGPVWNLTVAGSPTFQTAVGMSHNTVKAVKLMRWLVRLVCPVGGVVVDPFCGSGSTGLGALAEGMRFVGFEEHAPYAEIARARLGHAAPEATPAPPAPAQEPAPPAVASVSGALSDAVLLEGFL